MIMQIRPVSSSRPTKLLCFYCFGSFIFFASIASVEARILFKNDMFPKDVWHWRLLGSKTSISKAVCKTASVGHISPCVCKSLHLTLMYFSWSNWEVSIAMDSSTKSLWDVYIWFRIISENNLCDNHKFMTWLVHQDNLHRWRPLLLFMKFKGALWTFSIAGWFVTLCERAPFLN